MALTFLQMVARAREHVSGLSAERARAKIEANPHMLVVDVQDAVDAGACGLIPRGVNISLGMLPIRAAGASSLGRATGPFAASFSDVRSRRAGRFRRVYSYSP